ncbi:MAG: nitroreductase family protein [Cyanobacteria bacterium P01_G01_bin.67]
MVSASKPLIKTLSDLGLAQPKQLYQRVRTWFKNVLLNICVSSPRLSSFYYALFDSAMDREHQGVIYGKLQYQKSLTITQSPQYLLRRNIHRLEKGLIMRPRRDIFALDYLEETVAAYQNLIKGEQTNPSELKWAHDVLEEYFNVVTTHPVIERSQAIFKTIESLPGENKCIPYQRDLNQALNVNYEQFLALSYRRRSVRWYLPQPVPRELIDRAITAAALSPSACNRQPFEFRIFDDPKLVQQVSSVPMGTAGFSQNFPAVIVVVGKLRAYYSERDRHVIYIDASLAAMSLMYALETLGLSSCPINWPDIASKEKQMSQILSLEPDERVIILISLGYPNPEGMVPYSQKKPLAEIRRYN